MLELLCYLPCDQPYEDSPRAGRLSRVYPPNHGILTLKDSGHQPIGEQCWNVSIRFAMFAAMNDWSDRKKSDGIPKQCLFLRFKVTHTTSIFKIMAASVSRLNLGVFNQRKPAGEEANPNLFNIDLQSNQAFQACEQADIMNIGGFGYSVFNVISAFLADNNQRFVAEVEAIEL